MGDDDRAETHLADALDLHGRMHAPNWTANTQLTLVDVAARRRGADDADRAAGPVMTSEASSLGPTDWPGSRGR